MNQRMGDKSAKRRFIRHQTAARFFTTLWIVSLLFELAGPYVSPVAARASAAPALAVVWPPGWVPGANQHVTVTLVTDTARNLAGFQVRLLFDPARLAFAGVEPTDDWAERGRMPVVLGPARTGGAVEFGVATCPVVDCEGRPTLPLSEAPGLNGRVELARVTFYTLAADPGAVMVDGVQLVDPLGARTDVDEKPPLADGRPAWDARLDLTGNGILNTADADRVMEGWSDLRRAGRCIAFAGDARDLDKDGCVNVSDTQQVLAAWGQRSPALASVSGDIAAIQSGPPLTLTVNSGLDEPDNAPGDGVCLTSTGICTLPAAVQEANARGGRETITFNIRNPDNSCPTLVVIQPLSTTQIIVDDSDNSGMLIDGYTQCGAAVNAPSQSQPWRGTAVWKIELRGRRTVYDPDGSYHAGIEILSDNAIVRGLSVYDWYRSVYVNRASNIQIEGNLLGSNTSYSNGAYGEPIRLWNTENSTVGGAAPAARNVIVNGGNDGVNVEGLECFNNRVIGNYIGLRQDGVTVRRNVADGVDVAEGASYNQIGGLLPGERNVIAGNGRDGIEISHDNAVFNQFLGNYIGLAADGVTARGNGQNGVTHEDIVFSNTVASNIIVANGWNGVRFNPNADYNRIENNHIGVLPDGTAMGNGTDATVDHRNGVYIYAGSDHNLIRGNLIAYQPWYGVRISRLLDHNNEVHFNTVSQNSIYRNGKEGIDLSRSSFSTEPNQGMRSPRITSASPTVIRGTATLSNSLPCAGCTIEVFVADDAATSLDPDGETAGEGRTYLGSGVTDVSGGFVITVSGLSEGQRVTATTTDPAGNTSRFSQNNVVVLVNDPPVAVDDTAITSLSTPTTIYVLANDFDLDGQPLMVSAVGTPPAGSATTDGTTVTFTPSPGISGTQSFGYTLSDGVLTDTALITVTVDPTLNSPPLAGDDLFTIPEDTRWTASSAALLANDVDANGHGLTLREVSPASAQGGSVILVNNALTYTTPFLNYFGIDSFWYVVDDGHGGSDVGVVTITVTPVNDAPTLTGISDQTIDLNTTTGDLDFRVGDAETLAMSLTVTGTSSHPALIPNANIVLQIIPDTGGIERAVTVTPAPASFGIATITLTVSDGVLSTQTSFKVTVNGLRVYLPFIRR